MPQDKDDRRIARTRLALRNALLSLLPEKGWDDMSVQDICLRADVGRSTFYQHYRSKEELLSESLNELRDQLVSIGKERRGTRRARLALYERGLSPAAGST